jgi:hypothetical protein
MIATTTQRSVRAVAMYGFLVGMLAVGTWAPAGTKPIGAATRTDATEVTEPVVRAPDAATPMPMDASGGWRPKRPMLCAATVMATAIAGGLMSAIPNGGLVAFIAMVPLLAETCG